MNKENQTTLDEKWENLTIASDFLFGKVMQQKRLCLQFLQRLFPDMHITDINEPQPQKFIWESYDSHAVRLDIYVEGDEESAFDLEMQVLNKGDLRKRVRYSQSNMDLYQLSRGVPYSDLRDSYVIMICAEFDLFGADHKVYTFRNHCSEVDGLELGDGTTKIFLNPKGTKGDVSPELQAFLDYVDGHVSETDPYIQELDQAVQEGKRNEAWKVEFMVFEAKLMDAREEGRAEGRAEGKAEEADHLTRLYKYLLSEGLTEEAAALSENPELREELYEKYGIQPALNGLS